jgi:hypothetical protein
MQKRQNAILWAVIVSETSHIFCCVLPTLFTVLAMLASVGVFVMPAGLVAFHDVMHAWELPIIIGSGVILALGWIVHRHTLKGGDCDAPGCQHHPDPAHPKRSKTHMILIAATVLFCVNVTVYMVFHRGMGIGPGGMMEHAHDHAHDAHAGDHAGHEAH